jgi:hypothetical protein
MAEDRIPSEGLTGLEPLATADPDRSQGAWVMPAAVLSLGLAGLFLFWRKWKAARFLGGTALALLEKRREMGMARKVRAVLARSDSGLPHSGGTEARP